jgi:hypothetical protein
MHAAILYKGVFMRVERFERLEYVSSGQNIDAVFKCLGSLGNLALCKSDLCDVFGKTSWKVDLYHGASWKVDLN